ncbi:SCO family protein [Paenibacillaceae bacterium WGS1546]|uniref:SCO family protein n=1 Tax=Cohnella sp. WGS1546 TaxID=3366810 RepID=UPI00372D4B65
MSPRLKSYLFPVTLLTALLLIGAFFLYRSSGGAPGLPVVGPAADFTLTDLNGKPVKASDNAGRVVLMEFMFTSCPDICPLTTYKMVQLQERLKEQDRFGSEVRFVAVTFDPENDTQEALRKYADRMGLDLSGWQILRGEEAATRDIAAQYGIDVVNMGDGQFVHSVTSLQLIDAEQRVRKVYSMGEEMDNEEVMDDLTALLAERNDSRT